jgi:hypothetical protein
MNLVKTSNQGSAYLSNVAQIIKRGKSPESILGSKRSSAADNRFVHLKTEEEAKPSETRPMGTNSLQKLD